MRILHIITRLIVGGAQQNTIQSCAAQRANGHDVHLAFGPIYGPEGSLRDAADATSARLHEISSLRRAISPYHDIRCWYELRRLIRTLQPDVVHTHSTKAGIIGRAAAWTENAPAVIHTVHGLPFHDHQPRWVHRAYVACERWAARRCHHLIAITPQMVDAFETRHIAPRSAFTVIPSGIDIAQFQFDRAQGATVKDELGIPPNAPVIAIVARLDPLKGHSDLLAIFPKLREHLPDAHLLFLGDGWHRETLERQIDAAGIADRVHITGVVEPDEIAQLLTAVDVKVLPSYQEGQSRTLVEALAAGCAIVGYDVGGIPAVCIEGETGRLVPVGDRNALARAIIELFDEPDKRRRLVDRGREHVRNHFDVKQMVAKIEQVYHHAIEQGNRRE